MKTLVNILGEHPCIVNVLLGPVTVHCREVLLYQRMSAAQLYQRLGGVGHCSTQPASRPAMGRITAILNQTQEELEG